MAPAHTSSSKPYPDDTYTKAAKEIADLKSQLYSAKQQNTGLLIVILLLILKSLAFKYIIGLPPTKQ